MDRLYRHGDTRTERGTTSGQPVVNPGERDREGIRISAGDGGGAALQRVPQVYYAPEIIAETAGLLPDISPPRDVYALKCNRIRWVRAL